MRMQDMWTLSGIFRDVYILGRPADVHITDYHVQTPLQFDADGSLQHVALDVVVHLSARVRQYAPALRQSHSCCTGLHYSYSQRLSFAGALGAFCCTSAVQLKTARSNIRNSL